jgi:hypothetical protein
LNHTKTIGQILSELSAGKLEAARNIATQKYPHVPRLHIERSYSTEMCMRIFMRDGFIDRYSGDRLLFPGTLRILSIILPDEFPYQAHWKMNETHIAYWELYPTIDHIQPMKRGGKNEESNLVTTSQLRNSAKAHWTLEELGWNISPPGNLTEWDGLLKQSIQYIEAHPSLLEDKVLKKWYKAASK